MTDSIHQVRHLVRGLLESTDSFGQLPAHERKSVAASLVKILDYLADPYAGIEVPRRLAVAQAERKDTFAPNDTLRDRLAQRGPTANQDFTPGATKHAGQTFSNLVKSVDFPKFVSGLIEGVFSSIVKSSIKQMQAFQGMLEGIAKSADQFAKETISDASAREYLKNAYPRALDVTVGEGGESKLSLRDGVEDGDLPNLKADLGLHDDASFDDPESEAKIVFAAQQKLAKQRQQFLATMVLMGINRIVVTDGEIKASVLFDVRSKDTVTRDRFASTSDGRVRTESASQGGGWFDDEESAQTETRVSSAYSDEKEHSQSELEAKAKLSGSVTVKFKSETFPLERFASSDMLGFVHQKGNA
ncbi:MAG: hypothetical protein KF773_30725 [Deltaproteobacteria bacterium]|nr:hypothetical protein [Deltaproteobacteria bacterium]